MRCAGEPPRASDTVPGVLVDGELVPDWLSVGDLPWLRELLLGSAAFEGRPFAELRQAWRCGEVPPRAGERWRTVLTVLRQFVLPRRPASMSGLRAKVWAAVAAGASPEEALARAGPSAERVKQSLFADVGVQRPVWWPGALDADTLRRAVNGRFARCLLGTANTAELWVHGASRAVLRTAWLQGAYFSFAGREGVAARLRWSPPPGQPRAGHRLAALLPVLGWARRFVLRASCAWRGARADLVLSSLDALPVGTPPAAFDSAWESELGAALLRALPGWEVLREPAPLPIGERLVFPDFAVWPAGGEERPWWIELAGLRDRSALPGKVALLLGEERYVLCLPLRSCPRELLAHPRVVAFRRGTTRRGRALRGVAEQVAALLRGVTPDD
jgi:hypothetical protein